MPDWLYAAERWLRERVRRIQLQDLGIIRGSLRARFKITKAAGYYAFQRVNVDTC